MSGCAGFIWSDAKALTKLCRDSLQILAPDMDYVDVDTEVSARSQQSNSRKHASRGRQDANIMSDDDQDVIDTEAKRLAFHIAASDRIFSYAHAVSRLSL